MPGERIDRSVSLTGEVSFAELTGPQRIEARMLDCLSCSLIALPQFQGTEGARRLSAFFGGVSTVSDLEDRFQQSFGASLLARFKEIVVEQWGTLNGLNPESSNTVVQMNLVAWAKTPIEGEDPSVLVMGSSRPEPVMSSSLVQPAIQESDSILPEPGLPRAKVIKQARSKKGKTHDMRGLTGFYKGTYYENGIARSGKPNKQLGRTRRNGNH